MNGEFLNKVSLYVKDPENCPHKDLLLSPQNIHLTKEALLELKRDVEKQFSYQHSTNIKVKHRLMKQGREGLEEWHGHQTEYATWKSKVVPFLASIESCLSEIRIVKRQMHADNEYVEQLQDQVDNLLERIEEHRRQIGEQASEVDEELWEYVDALQNS